MKNIIRNIITLTIFFTALLSLDQAWAVNNKDFKDVEILYQACLTAQEKYKDNPEEIWKSDCGAYIQGLFWGQAIIYLHLYSRFSKDEYKYYREKVTEDLCVDSTRPLHEIIAKFISWREKHSDYNNISAAGLIESLNENTKCSKKNTNLNKD